MAESQILTCSVNCLHPTDDSLDDSEAARDDRSTTGMDRQTMLQDRLWDRAHIENELLNEPETDQTVDARFRAAGHHPFYVMPSATDSQSEQSNMSTLPPYLSLSRRCGRTCRDRERSRHRRRMANRHQHHRHRRHSRPRNHRNNLNHGDSRYTEEEGTLKSCCSLFGCKICLSLCLQFKKVLIFFASFGVLCIATGVLLGVLRAPGNSFFTLSLMFVGLGLILLAMVLIGWKCTPNQHEPCHMLFGLGIYSTMGRRDRRDRRRRERLYWVGGMLYPEFRNRRPPPSYAAAMRDYLNELRQRHNQSLPHSPPPSYKSHASVERPAIHTIFPECDYFPNSNPPTYRQTTQPSRPSLATMTVVEPDPHNPDSMSSTQALVEADQAADLHSGLCSGMINLSFNDYTLEHDQV